MAGVVRLVRDVVGTLNGGQFRQLSELFCDEKEPLYFHMTVEQVIDNEEAILHEHTGLLMRVFLSALKPEAAVVRSEKRQKTEEIPVSVGLGNERHGNGRQQVTRLVFDAAALPLVNRYGMRPEQMSKAFAKQLLRFVDHMTRPINLERAGPKVIVKTAEEQKASVLRFGGYLVNVRGANPDAVSIEHVLEKDLVLQFDHWLDCNRGIATNSRRKDMQHLCSVATFALVLFPALGPECGGVPDVYRRLVNQLKLIEAQEVKTQSDLIRDKLWLPFPVLMELASSRCVELERAVAIGSGSDKCAELAMQAALLMLMSRQSWRSVELTSLEVVSQEELQSLAKRAKQTQSEYLETCGRNFIVRPTAKDGNWVVLTNTYKTVGRYQTLEDTLVPEVGKALRSYLDRHRQTLLCGREHKYAFVGPTGLALTGSDIADMFQKLTGVRLLCNVRRKATVTWALSQPDMDRQSLARLMRHSEKQQFSVYDQRKNDVRTNSAVMSIEGLAQGLNAGAKKRSRAKAGNVSAVAGIKLGDVVEWGNGSYGKVIDMSRAVGGSVLTLLTLMRENGSGAKLRPIFGDAALLQCFPVFQFVAESSVIRVPNVEYDDKSDVYLIRQLKKGK